jgi:hypothetical protein
MPEANESRVADTGFKQFDTTHLAARDLGDIV